MEKPHAEGYILIVFHGAGPTKIRQGGSSQSQACEEPCQERESHKVWRMPHLPQQAPEEGMAQSQLAEPLCKTFSLCCLYDLC